MNKLKGRVSIIIWRIVERIMLFILLIIFVVTILGVGIILIWSPKSMERVSIKNPLATKNQILEVTYPKIIEISDTPQILFFTRHSTNEITSTLTVTFEMPSDLILTKPIGYEHGYVAAVVFPPTQQQVQTNTVEVSNAQIHTNILLNKHSIVLHGSDYTTATISLAVEGTGRAALRNVLIGESGKNSSTFVLIPVFLTAAGLLYTLLQQQRTKQKEDAAKLWSLFSNYLQGGDIEKARSVWQELIDSNMQIHLSADRVKSREYLLSIANSNLLSVAEVNLIEKTISQVEKNYPIETVQAFLFAIQTQPNSSDQGKLKAIAQRLGSLKLTDELSQKLSEFSSFGFQVPQSRIWPIIKDVSELEINALKIDDWFVNPIGFEKAEDELAFLFGNSSGLFWRHHPLYSELGAATKTCFIGGDRGSGRTALAHALSDYYHPKTFGCYLSGQPTFNDIQYEFVRSILNFVNVYPTFLAKFDRETRGIFSTLIVSVMSKQIALVDVNKRRLRFEHEMMSLDNGQQRYSASIAGAQLRLLAQSIENTKSDFQFNEQQSISAIVLLMEFLEFKQARLALDLGGNNTVQWLRENLVPKLYQWNSLGLNVLIFAYKEAIEQAQNTFLNDNFAMLKLLKWDSYSLNEMIQYRYRGLKPSPILLEEIISDDLLNQLIIGAQLNPRNLAIVWNHTIRLAKHDLAKRSQINEEHVQRAISDLR